MNAMKKFLWLLWFVTISVHAAGDSIGGTLSPNATFASTKPCGTGYTRLTPNFCKSNTYNAIAFTMTAGAPGACTQTTALTGVTDAKGVLFQVAVGMQSRNVAGQRVTTGSFFDATNCLGTIKAQVQGIAYEFSAVSAGTIIEQNTSFVPVVTNGNGQVFTQQADTNGPHTINLYVAGYFD